MRKRVHPWEIWDTRDWTLVSKHSDETLARMAFQRVKGRSKRYALLYRDNAGNLIDPAKLAPPSREPSNVEVRRKLQAVGAPELPGFELARGRER